MRPGTQTEKKPGNPLPNLSMYEVPGHGPATEHDYQRYLRSKANYDEAIKALVEKQKVEHVTREPKVKFNILSIPKHQRADHVKAGLTNPDPEVQKESVYFIDYLPEDQQPLLREQVVQVVKTSLANPNPEIQKGAVYLIDYAPKDKRADLVNMGLASSNPEVQRVSISMIFEVSKDKQPPLREKVVQIIKSGLSSLNFVAIKNAADLIDYVPEEQQALFREQVFQIVKTGLVNTDPEIQKISASMISSVTIDKLAPLINAGLNCSNLEVQKICASVIKTLPEDQQPPLREQVVQLVKAGLANPNPEIQKSSASLVRYAPVDQKVNLVKAGLTHDNPEVQIISADLITSVPEDNQGLLMKVGLSSPNFEVQRHCVFLIQEIPMYLRENIIETGLSNPNPEVQKWFARMIFYTGQNEQITLRKKVGEMVEAGLANPNPEIQKSSASLVRYASWDQRVDLILAGLNNHDSEVQKRYVSMIQYAPEEMQTFLREHAVKKGLSKYLIAPPLYSDQDVNNTLFSRAKFEKTGSELTLFGGGLKDKTVMRRITAEAFLAWQKLYEDSELWEKHGFDYVPIEPIQSFALNKEGTVSVYCGVLDLSLASWEKSSSLFKESLRAQEEKILNVLGEQEVVHGHDHRDNFCLKFFRDSDGAPDFTREPRIYLIDFDQAVS